MNLLYVTWDGPQVNYLEELFAPILSELRNEKNNIYIYQFTWGDDKRIRATYDRCNEFGLYYKAQRIIRTPRVAGALVSLCIGIYRVTKVLREKGIQVVICRGVVPSLCLLFALRWHNIPLVFDSDGLPLDEMVEFSGLSPTGVIYGFLRQIEYLTLRRAAVILTRSRQGSITLHARAGGGIPATQFYTVTNGRDINRFRYHGDDERARIRSQLNIPFSAPLIIYVGSLGPKYCLNSMLRVFESVRDVLPNSRFLILSPSYEYFQSFRRKENLSDVIFVSVPSEDVPIYISAADLGLALIESTFSTRAASAIKTAEYLLCGVPVVSTSGIGDIDSQLSDECGLIVDYCHDPDLGNQVADWFSTRVLTERSKFRERCIRLGRERFSLHTAVDDYRRALGTILD
jgi:glycosyltransferase involved in cell wall biosynthesis